MRPTRAKIHLFLRKDPTAELSGDFAMIIKPQAAHYHGKIVRSSDWLARSKAER
jgi:hypothetical protein